MRLIDADKLKAHYAWWGNEEKETFDAIVDAQPTVDPMTVISTGDGVAVGVLHGGLVIGAKSDG